MTADSSAMPAHRATPSFWGKLKIPALLLLIAVNVVYFGGNAVLDLWQTLGPAHHFSGTIVGHEQVTQQSGEESETYNLVTIDTGHGQIKLNVFPDTYTATSIGQHVTGSLDARGLFGHDEGLRSLSADGHSVFSTQPLGRAAGQAIILVVVVTVGALATKLVLRQRGRRDLSLAPP